jgi:large subunit ribosomal protein L21
MYAIVETGGKQYRVHPGDTISVERLPAEPGETLELGSVLLVGGDGEQTRVGAPSVAGAVVRAEVLEHARGDKIIVFRFKSKVRYRRKTGHRQALTRLRITDILLDGKSAGKREPTRTTPEPAQPETTLVAAATETATSQPTPAPARRRRAAAATTEVEAANEPAEVAASAEAAVSESEAVAGAAAEPGPHAESTPGAPAPAEKSPEAAP